MRTERWGARLGLKRKAKQEGLPGGGDPGHYRRAERELELPEPHLQSCKDGAHHGPAAPLTPPNVGHTGGPRGDPGGLVRFQHSSSSPGSIYNLIASWEGVSSLRVLHSFQSFDQQPV